MNILKLSVVILLSGCSATQHLKNEIDHKYKKFANSKPELNIDSLVTTLDPLSSRERERIIVPLMLAGNIPSFQFRFRKINLTYTDSSGKTFKSKLFVSPDYLSLGNNEQFMRMPLTPQAAQLIADTLHAVLPTKKIVDEIYLNSVIRLEPQPLSRLRELFTTFLQHNKIIQQQVGSKHSFDLVAGIKKDVVQSPAIYRSSKPNRVAIYGWHQLNGMAIQPLYTGHADWYVDYSHGIRLVYEKMIINGKLYFIKDILNDPILFKIVSDEAVGGFTRYKD